MILLQLVLENDLSYSFLYSVHNRFNQPMILFIFVSYFGCLVVESGSLNQYKLNSKRKFSLTIQTPLSILSISTLICRTIADTAPYRYSTQLPYKLNDQNQDKDLFIPIYAIKNAPVKGIIASVQAKFTFFLVFMYSKEFLLLD